MPKELTSPSISLKGEDSDDVTDEGEDKVTSFEPEPEVIFTSFEPEVIFKSVKSDAVYYDAVFKTGLQASFFAGIVNWPQSVFSSSQIAGGSDKQMDEAACG